MVIFHGYVSLPEGTLWEVLMQKDFDQAYLTWTILLHIFLHLYTESRGTVGVTMSVLETASSTETQQNVDSALLVIQNSY